MDMSDELSLQAEYLLSTAVQREHAVMQQENANAAVAAYVQSRRAALERDVIVASRAREQVQLGSFPAPQSWCQEQWFKPLKRTRVYQDVAEAEEAPTW